MGESEKGEAEEAERERERERQRERHRDWCSVGGLNEGKRLTENKSARRKRNMSAFTGARLARPGKVQVRSRPTSSLRLVTTCKESPIGKRPVETLKSEVKLRGQVLTVKGPLGTLTREFPSEIALTLSDDKKSISFKKTEETRKAKQLHGLCRT